MSLNADTIEQILAFEAGELEEQEQREVRQSMATNPEMVELLESWKLLTELTQTDDSVSPPDAVLARAMRLNFTLPSSGSSPAVEGVLTLILDKVDNYVARLIHDNRVSPGAIRSGSNENLHQVWEVGDFDVDIIADKSAQSGCWTLRGQIMSDDNIEGLPIAIVLAGSTNVYTESNLDDSGVFSFDLNSGTWGLRIGTEEKSVTLEPIAL